MIIIAMNFFIIAGVFQPPEAGVYLLTAYAVSYGSASGYMYIKNNDAVLCQVYVYESNAYSATCSTIAQLAVGDSGRITGSSSYSASIQSGWSGFVGHIISDNLTA